MKTHRSLLFVLGATLLAGAPGLRAGDAPRPDGPPPFARGERMGGRMAERLGLSDDQKAKMKQIGEQERAELEKLRADASLDQAARRAQWQAIHEKYRAQRDAILTPEQKAKSDAMRAKMADRRERMEKRMERREKPGF